MQQNQQNQQQGWNQWDGGWGGWGNWNQNQGTYDFKTRIMSINLCLCLYHCRSLVTTTNAKYFKLSIFSPSQ